MPGETLDGQSHSSPEPKPEHTYALVLEGGGAKGIAYVAALAAIEERELRIGATAGASAGAISAALIAAGFSSQELRSKIPEGLQQLGNQLLSGSRSRMAWQWLIDMGPRLSKTGAAFDTSGLRTWLSGLLEKKKNQLLAKPSLDLSSNEVATLKETPGDQLTFAQLFSLTNVELFVVAANVSRSEEIVFHHETTPECQVVDAVLASSAIPGALPSGKLVVDEPHRLSHPRRLHTIVDGGVWSNYPEFVFKDAAFRMSQDLGPLEHTVIGLILDESVKAGSGSSGNGDSDVDGDRHRYRTAKFTVGDEAASLPRHEAVLAADATALRAFHVLELLSTKEGIDKIIEMGGISKLGRRVRQIGTLTAALTAAVSLLGLIVAPIFWAWFRSNLVMLCESLVFLSVFVAFRFARGRPERAPREASAPSVNPRFIEDAWPRNRIMSTIRPLARYFNPFIAWIPLLAIAFMTVQFAVDLDARAAAPLPVLDFLAPLRGFLWFIAVTSGFGLTAFCVLAVWGVFWGGRAAGDIGWGVLKTYFAGPGAPRWRGRGDDDHVIRIPIPRDLGTLSFNVGLNEESERDEKNHRGQGVVHLSGVLTQTRKEVVEQLDEILRVIHA